MQILSDYYGKPLEIKVEFLMINVNTRACLKPANCVYCYFPVTDSLQKFMAAENLATQPTTDNQAETLYEERTRKRILQVKQQSHAGLLHCSVRVLLVAQNL